MPKKIALYQSINEYPSLHLHISDNPRYHEGRLCVDDVEQAIAKVSKWLREKFADGN